MKFLGKIDEAKDIVNREFVDSFLKDYLPDISLGSLSNVGSWADSVASQDRIMYQAANSSQWVAKNLSDLNVTGGYLPLTGGTLSGSIKFTNSYALINAHYDTSGNSSNVLYVSPASASVIYGSPSWVNVLFETSSNQVIRMTGGVQYKIWDEGNDGSGSGLDADLLDGIHSYDFFRKVAWNPDINSYGDYSNANGIIYINTSDNDAIHAPFKYGSILSMNYDAASWMLSCSSNGSLGFRHRWWSGNGTVWSDWKTIALTDSNVASATKLQTARTIWGQSFNGTADITGDLKLGLSRILGIDDAVLVTSSTDAVTFGYGTSAKGIPTYIDGYNVFLRYGTSRTTGLILNSSGNVGIGTGSPLYKLDVRGIMMCQYMRFNSYTDASKQIGYIGRGLNAVDDLILSAENGQLRFYANGGNTNPMTFKNQNLTVPGNVYATGFWSNIPSGGAVAKFRIISDESTNATWFQSANYAGTSVNGSIYLSGYNANALTLCKVQGPLLVTGGITMYSDARKKTILNHVELSLKQIADAPLIEHYYNSDEKKTTHVGSIAQYWYDLNDWFCKEDNEGFLTMEIQNAALASAISIARELDRYEDKTDKRIATLEAENERLKQEIELLKWNIA